MAQVICWLWCFGVCVCVCVCVCVSCGCVFYIRCVRAELQVCMCVFVCPCICSWLVRPPCEAKVKIGRVCRSRISCWIWLIWQTRTRRGGSVGLGVWHTPVNKHPYITLSIPLLYTHTHTHTHQQVGCVNTLSWSVLCLAQAELHCGGCLVFHVQIKRKVCL